VKLVVSSPEGNVSSVEPDGTITLGRAAENNLVLKDPKVSRRHAVIHVRPDGQFLIDLGSANGSYVNGARVVLPTRLQGGDVITVGSTTVTVVEDESRVAEYIIVARTPDQTATVIGLEKREISVLVADVRGYTSLSERLPVEQLSQVMGSWFRRVGVLVQQHNGLIDKFMGDGVMAVWVANPGDPGRSVEEAVAAALDLYQESTVFPHQLPFWPKGERFRVGIGLNTGAAILGTLGTQARRDYTATGDTVNVAFRLEPLTKTFPYPIVASEETVRHVRGRYPFEPLGPVGVKGKSQAVTVYGLDPASVR
jgi:adenylate cyclase